MALGPEFDPGLVPGWGELRGKGAVQIQIMMKSPDELEPAGKLKVKTPKKEKSECEKMIGDQISRKR
jgi:hypothetical protein